MTIQYILNPNPIIVQITNRKYKIEVIDYVHCISEIKVRIEQPTTLLLR